MKRSISSHSTPKEVNNLLHNFRKHRSYIISSAGCKCSYFSGPQCILDVCLTHNLPLLASAIQITAFLIFPCFSVQNPVTFFSGLLCHDLVLLQLPCTIPLHLSPSPSQLCLLLLELQRACYLGLISYVGSPRDDQTCQSLFWSFLTEVFLTQ